MDNFILETLLRTSVYGTSLLGRYHNELTAALRVSYHLYCAYTGSSTLGEGLLNVTIRGRSPSLKYLVFLICKHCFELLLSHQNESSLISKLSPILRILFVYNTIQFIRTGDFPSIWNRLFGFPYSKIQSKDTQLSFNYLMKKVIFSNLGALMIFLLDTFLNKPNLKLLLQRFFSDGLEAKSASDTQCSSCRQVAFLPKRQECCSRTFCYYCLSRHPDERGSTCPG